MTTYIRRHFGTGQSRLSVHEGDPDVTPRGTAAAITITGPSTVGPYWIATDACLEIDDPQPVDPKFAYT